MTFRRRNLKGTSRNILAVFSAFCDALFAVGQVNYRYPNGALTPTGQGASHFRLRFIFLVLSQNGSVN